MIRSAAMLEEFDLEMAFTRLALERVPEGAGSWAPHEKSMPLGKLAGFLAVLVSWGRDILIQDEFDVMGPMPPLPALDTSAQRLALFDANVAETRAALLTIGDAALDQPWALRAGPATIWARPRWLVYRTYFLNHMVHHRGQLTVYLRMQGVAVPAIYNDSADEKGGMFAPGAPSR